MSHFKPTQEQLEAIKAVKENQFVKISAYAGCSKTTTLQLVSETIKTKSLYICFNKANADEAAERFPSHVECRTSHSLAFRAVGRFYSKKLNRDKTNENRIFTSNEIAEHFKIKDFVINDAESISQTALGLAIRNTVSKFEQSASEEIGIEHTYHSSIHTSQSVNPIVDTKLRNLVLGYAKKLWELRKDFKSNCLISHDTYLKLWQLSNPVLKGYDIIYLDEAQDSNPCLLDIVLKQQCKIVMVGDGYQSIYAWRGAVNAMSVGVKQWKESLLSTSFRYGKNIAYIANCILGISHSSDSKVKGYKELDNWFTDKQNIASLITKDQHTRIYRTNASLINDAVSALASGVSCRIEVDTKDFVRLLQSAIYLKQNRIDDVSHEDIIPYSSWSEFEEDAQFSTIVSIIKQGGVFDIINTLKAYKHPKNPQVTFTTAHKSKGREWETVLLASDFKSNTTKEGEWIGLDDQERNLLYVAATRATKNLIVNSTVLEFVERNGK